MFEKKILNKKPNWFKYFGNLKLLNVFSLYKMFEKKNVVLKLELYPQYANVKVNNNLFSWNIF